MLIVTLTLRHAVTGTEETLSTVQILNDGTGTPATGHYALALLDRQGHRVASARCEEFARTDGAIVLAQEALYMLVSATPREVLRHATGLEEEPR